MILLDFLGRAISSSVSFMYPSYASFKALESKDPDQFATWLTYWVVLGLTITFEDLIADPVFGWWLPMYYIFKLAFVIWLQLPITKGARLTYLKLVLPILKQHQSKIDGYLDAGCRRIQTTPFGSALFQDAAGGSGSGSDHMSINMSHFNTTGLSATGLASRTAAGGTRAGMPPTQPGGTAMDAAASMHADAGKLS